METPKQREDRPSQTRTNSPPCPDQIGYLDQGPKGNTEVKPVSSSLLRAMEEASKTSGQTPWLHVTLTEAIKARLSSLSAPNPLGLGLAPIRDRDTAPQREPSYLDYP